MTAARGSCTARAPTGDLRDVRLGPPRADGFSFDQLNENGRRGTGFE